MVTEAISQKRALRSARPTVVTDPLADATSAAERAWATALAACAERMGLEGSRAAADQIRKGNHIARMNCCRGLAEEIAASLRSWCKEIRAVYAPCCDVCPQGFCAGAEEQAAPTVHLLIWAQCRTPALGVRAALLDRALARVCEDMMGLEEVPGLLQARVIDDRDLERLLGAGRKDRWSSRLQAHFLAMNEVMEELGNRETAA
jgi:hypothetical protein